MFGFFRKFAAVIPLAFLLVGCHKSERTLVGEWDLYTPFSQDPGKMSFTATKFTESITAPIINQHVNVSGEYRVTGAIIILDYHGMAASGVGLASSSKATSSEFEMEWKSDDLIYLTQNQPGMKAVIALAKNGAKPDLKRLDLTFDSSKMTNGGKWTVKPAPGNDTPSKSSSMSVTTPNSQVPTSQVPTQPDPVPPQEQQPQQPQPPATDPSTQQPTDPSQNPNSPPPSDPGTQPNPNPPGNGGN